MILIINLSSYNNLHHQHAKTLVVPQWPLSESHTGARPPTMVLDLTSQLSTYYHFLVWRSTSLAALNLTSSSVMMLYLTSRLSTWCRILLWCSTSHHDFGSLASPIVMLATTLDIINIVVFDNNVIDVSLDQLSRLHNYFLCYFPLSFC